MPAIKTVGKVFDNAASFLAYLESVQFGAWRPRFVTMHHTGSPTLKVWQGWQTRAKPVTDEQWLYNLADYYGKPAPGKSAWSAGPHFFFTPKHFCVLSPPNARGVHAVSFNASSWAVECVGDFDTEIMTPELQAHYVEGLACLHVALGTQPAPYEWNVRGLHFHRDDPKTNKTCPGKSVRKEIIVPKIRDAMAVLTGTNDAPAEQVLRDTTGLKPAPRTGVVTGAGPLGLNVRADASAKAPKTDVLKDGTAVQIIGEALNGATLWFQISGGWVAARFVKV